MLLTLIFWYALSQKAIPHVLHTFTAGPVVVQQVDVVAVRVSRRAPHTYWIEVEDAEGNHHEVKVAYDLYQHLEDYRGPIDVELRRSWFGLEVQAVHPPTDG